MLKYYRGFLGCFLCFLWVCTQGAWAGDFVDCPKTLKAKLLDVKQANSDKLRAVSYAMNGRMDLDAFIKQLGAKGESVLVGLIQDIDLKPSDRVYVGTNLLVLSKTLAAQIRPVLEQFIHDPNIRLSQRALLLNNLLFAGTLMDQDIEKLATEFLNNTGIDAPSRVSLAGTFLSKGMSLNQDVEKVLKALLLDESVSIGGPGGRFFLAEKLLDKGMVCDQEVEATLKRFLQDASVHEKPLSRLKARLINRGILVGSKN